MKTYITAILIAFSIAARAQDVLPNKVYRITAYQNGNNNITSTSNYAEVIPPTSIFIPSAFTPNEDGINDSFGVKGEGIQNFKMLIYNRWGEVVYSSTNPTEHWDGKFNNQPVENGVYVYEVFAKGYGKHPKAGSVTLLR
ncbi:MAG: gliding motility-associated C-terminal domain-containing protein [Bacteroidota bacterium]